MNQDFQDMLGLLLDEGADFLLVGAHALAVHQRPRATGDMDVWVRPTAENAKRVWRALSRFGAPLERFSESDFAAPGIVAQFGVPPLRIDILTSLTALDFDQAWRNRTTVQFEGLAVPVIGKAEFILNKRNVGRSKDLKDVRRVERPTRGKKSKPPDRPV